MIIFSDPSLLVAIKKSRLVFEIMRVLLPLSMTMFGSMLMPRVGGVMLFASFRIVIIIGAPSVLVAVAFLVSPETLLTSDLHSDLPFWVIRGDVEVVGRVTKYLEMVRRDILILHPFALVYAAIYAFFFLRVFPDIAPVDIVMSVGV